MHRLDIWSCPSQKELMHNEKPWAFLSQIMASKSVRTGLCPHIVNFWLLSMIYANQSRPGPILWFVVTPSSRHMVDVVNEVSFWNGTNCPKSPAYLSPTKYPDVTIDTMNCRLFPFSPSMALSSPKRSLVIHLLSLCSKVQSFCPCWYAIHKVHSLSLYSPS